MSKENQSQTKEQQKRTTYLKIINLMLFLIVPLVAFYISELIWNPNVFQIPFVRILPNYMILAGIQIGLFVICNSFRITYSIILFSGYLYGLANYYVLLFKGNPLLPSDLLSYQTAMRVISNYTFTVSTSILRGTVILLLSLGIIYLAAFHNSKRNLKKLVQHVFLGFIWCALFIKIITSISWANFLNISLDVWQPENTYYENGAVFSFLLECQSMQVKKPVNYSAKIARRVLADYTDKEVFSDTSHPSVIIIMNESFSDLSIIGDIESDEYLANFNSIDNYIMRGNTYVSIHGGGTCNSEFEFLTGCSMGNFETTVYPYQMYPLSQANSLAKTFSANGYKTVAIHPAPKDNWNRETVYQQLGFDDFISLEDMEDVEYIRYYPSDAYNYKQVISAYENADGPAFIFNVTMQNHGGYSNLEDLVNIEPVQVEEAFQEYEDVITYMTLIRESDKAFKALLDYFSQVNEPVIICMFGDHMPNLSMEFYETFLTQEEINAGQQLTCTPYIIWSNYETDINKIQKNTSLNYLGATILDLTQIYTPYTGFLLDMQKSIPAVNVKGYQTADGQWHTHTEPDILMDQYRCLQYYMLFDKH